jgi:hypothetical protein
VPEMDRALKTNTLIKFKNLESPETFWASEKWRNFFLLAVG